MPGQFYRLRQRILHRFDLHHMPGHWVTDGAGGGAKQYWCQWCGMRWADPATRMPKPEGWKEVRSR